MKQCDTCRKWLPLEQFSASACAYDKLQPICKRCASAVTAIARRERERDPGQLSQRRERTNELAKMRRRAKKYPSAAELVARMLAEREEGAQ